MTDQAVRREFSDKSKDIYTYTADGDLKLVERWSAPQTQGGTDALRTHWRQFNYDPLTGQVATVSSPEGIISYTYHSDGSLATIKTSAGYDVAYTYDALGNIKTVSGKSVGGIVTYTYNDKTGRKTKVERPNGVTTDYVYTTRGFLQSITDAKDAEPVLTQSYTRDKRGLVLTLTETRPSESATVWTYTYDDLKRLATATAAGQNPASYSYTYDKAGNRKTKTVDSLLVEYVYNALDQLILETPASGSAKSYEYDIYGNLTVEKQGSNPKQTYTWDADNRLKSVLFHENNKTYSFRYDANGTRVKKEVSGGGAESVRTNYLSDYINPSGYSQALHETDEAGESRAYIWSGEGILAQSGLSSSGESSGGGGPPVSTV